MKSANVTQPLDAITQWGVADRPRSGIIGTGFMGMVHARAVRAAGGRVTAVAASSRERAERMAVTLHAESAAASAEALIASDAVDIVHVCTPNNLHEPLAKLAISAGKHVICEKPLAIHAEGAQYLAELAAGANVTATVPFVYRFYSSVHSARSRIRDGQAQALHLIYGHYLQDWLSRAEDNNWRTESARGGPSRAFADIGIHWVDLAEFVSGHRINRLCARTLTACERRRSPGGDAAIDTEDAATLMFETDHGAIGSVVISQVSPGRKNLLWLCLDGPEEGLAFDQERPDCLWVGTREEARTIARGTGPRHSMTPARWDILPPGHPQGYQDAFNAFVAATYAAAAGSPPDGLPTFADGLRSAQVTAAALRSADSGTWQAVP